MSKPRTASLRVAHQRGCPRATKTSLDSLGRSGDPPYCACRPSYYTFHRDRSGSPVKGPRIRDRQVADRALRKLQVELDEDRAEVGPRRRQAKTFDAWADDYLEILRHDKARKGSTVRAYETTFSYARPVLGHLDLDEVGPAELRQVVRKIREREKGGSDATVHKHLRHLRAVLEAAVDEELATRNPLTRKFITGLKLRVPRRVESYTDEELTLLFAKMDALKYDPVYVYVAKAAVATGARIGELIALDWNDLSLATGELRIRHTWDPIDGKVLPKDGEARTVYLARKPQAPDLVDGVGLFESWTARQGVRPGGTPIFSAPRGDRLNGQYVRKLIDVARERAGIAEIGEGGGKRKPLHAFRASYSRITREAGYADYLRQENLGHSSLDLTDGLYGRPTADALRKAARGGETITA